MFSLFALILTKAIPKSFSLYFCPYCNQSTAKKSVFLYYCFNPSQSPALILTQALHQRVFYCIFALILTKNLPLMMFFSFVALILPKALPKRFFFFHYFCPYSNLASPKRLFCHNPYQSHATKGVFFSTFSLILTKALKQIVFYCILPLFLPKSCH